jgi:hypothetical protein
MRTKRIIMIVLAVCLAVTMVSLGGCKKKEEKPKPKKTVVKEAEPPEMATVYYWPLTGLEAPSAKAIKRRPISVKIENSPASWPQMGLNSADIVYQTRVEGDMSRMNCIFQSNIPDEVGPVRSARLSDAWIVPQYKAMLYYSGSNKEVRARLNGAGVKFGPIGDTQHRVSFRSAPHNLYMYTKDAYKVAKKAGVKLYFKTLKPLYFGTVGVVASEPAITALVTASAIGTGAAISSGAGVASGSAAGDSPVAVATTGAGATGSSGGAIASGAAFEGPIGWLTGEAISSVEIKFYSPEKWKWDAKAKVFKLYTSGNKHLDGATDEQVWTDNVVVLYAEYPRASSVDPAGSPTYDTILGGEGEAKLFRDGYVYDCTWKADKDTPPALYAQDGTQLPLKPGKTWFEVPAIGETKVTIE